VRAWVHAHEGAPTLKTMFKGCTIVRAPIRVIWFSITLLNQSDPILLSVLGLPHRYRRASLDKQWETIVITRLMRTLERAGFASTFARSMWHQPSLLNWHAGVSVKSVLGEVSFLTATTTWNYAAVFFQQKEERKKNKHWETKRSRSRRALPRLHLQLGK